MNHITLVAISTSDYPSLNEGLAPSPGFVFQKSRDMLIFPGGDISQVPTLPNGEHVVYVNPDLLTRDMVKEIKNQPADPEFAYRVAHVIFNPKKVAAAWAAAGQPAYWGVTKEQVEAAEQKRDEETSIFDLD